MGHRIAQQHRLRPGKFAVVENKHEFATVRIETLNGVRDSAGEKPKIVFLYIGDKTFSVRVVRRDPRRAVKHDRPFAGRVPMQLPHASGGQPHVYARHVLRDGQFPDGHLPRPTAFVSSLVRKRERILEVLDQALGVRGRWPDGIRILAIKPGIGWTGITLASVCTRDFLQRGKAADRGSGRSDKTATSKCAHDYVS